MAPIRIEAPQIDTAAIASAGKSVTDSMMQSLAMKQGMENITKTQAETAAINAQRDKSEVETAFMRENNPLTIEGTKTFLPFKMLPKLPKLIVICKKLKESVLTTPIKPPTILLKDLLFQTRKLIL